MNLKEAQRYIRQTTLPEWGLRGQERLAQASVLVAGAGGLGSVICLYLAAAGIGRIMVADHDCLEPSNLNRQIIHDESALGINKAHSASQRITGLNSLVKVQEIRERLTEKSIIPLAGNVDLIVDGTDNYQTRRAINRASLKTGTPWIFGGVRGFGGLVSLFRPGHTACFECVIKPPKTAEGNSIGVTGPTAGIVGSFQAMAAVRHLIGETTGLENRLMHIAGERMHSHLIKVTPDPECPACHPQTSQGKTA